MSVTIRDIIEAERVIRPYIRTTPVMEVDPADFGMSWRGRMTLKLECMQHAGSFKPRGAFASLLTPERETRPIAAASGGNHGAAVAHAAKTLGLEATIFVPEISSPAKIAKIRATGCDLRIGGANYAEALAACQAFQAESGARDIHAYDAHLTVAGQGTLGIEWASQCHDLTHVLIAIGGGGLISGVLCRTKRDWGGARGIEGRPCCAGGGRACEGRCEIAGSGQPWRLVNRRH
jgi:threonine dehydratase